MSLQSRCTIYCYFNFLINVWLVRPLSLVKGVRGIFFMFSLKGLTPYLWAVSVVGSAYLGYSLTSSYYQIKLVTMEKQSEQILNEAQKAKTQKEQEFFTEALNVQSNLSEDIQGIASTYNHYFSDFLPGNSGWLQQSDNTSSSKDVSPNSSTTSSISQSKCQCDGTDKTKLRKLYEQQLTIARDCDITASYYNNLIDLYNKVSK